MSTEQDNIENRDNSKNFPAGKTQLICKNVQNTGKTPGNTVLAWARAMQGLSGVYKCFSGLEIIRFYGN